MFGDRETTAIKCTASIKAFKNKMAWQAASILNQPPEKL
jgi:hypothetical protein